MYMHMWVGVCRYVETLKPVCQREAVIAICAGTALLGSLAVATLHLVMQSEHHITATGRGRERERERRETEREAACGPRVLQPVSLWIEPRIESLGKASHG